MNERIFFKETQKFGSPSLYISMGVIYVVVIGVFVYGLYQQLVLENAFGNKPMSDMGLILTFVLVLLILFLSAWLLFSSRLIVEITKAGIRFRFWPYFKKTKEILASEIDQYVIRQYKPLSEYGGWGVKKGVKAKGIAYNVSGNIGLQLVLKDGRRILIGTQRKEAMLRAMHKMMELKNE